MLEHYSIKGRGAPRKSLAAITGSQHNPYVVRGQTAEEHQSIYISTRTRAALISQPRRRRRPRGCPGLQSARSPSEPNTQAPGRWRATWTRSTDGRRGNRQARRCFQRSLRAEAHTVPAARARRCEFVPPCVTFRGRRGIPSWSPGLKRPDRRMEQGRRRGAGARGGRRMLYMDRLPCVVSAWARQIAARSPPGTDTSESPVTGCCEDETFEAEQTRSAQP